jgi:hypothetical protein
MLAFERYVLQRARWPSSGRHILAQFDATTIVVYQAFDPGIADEAVRLGRFGSAFSLSRMSWIKPNFLWMMFRCGWATKPGQLRVLALRLTRAFFERVLAAAVPSSFDQRLFASQPEWQEAVARSDVRLQWDPDHDPSGAPLERRAIQLGLRGTLLREFAREAIVELDDVTEMVATQRAHASAPFTELHTPLEREFLPTDHDITAALGLAVA